MGSQKAYCNTHDTVLKPTCAICKVYAWLFLKGSNKIVL